MQRWLDEVPAGRPVALLLRHSVRDFVEELHGLGTDGEAILSGNVDKLLKQPAQAA